MTRRLVIVDAPSTEWVDRSKATAASGDAFEVVLLGLPETALAPSESAPAFRLVDLSAFAEDAHARVNDFVLEFFGNLPDAQIDTGNLSQDLHDGRRNLWWYLDVSERSPFRGPLINRLYFLGLIRAVLAAGSYDEVWVDLTDGQLAEAIVQATGEHPPIVSVRPARAGHGAWSAARYLLNALKLLVHFLGARLASAAIRWPQPNLTTVRAAIYTMFPQWWLSPYTSGATDRFFSAGSSDPGKYVYVAWLNRPLQLWRERSRVSEVADARSIIPLQPYLPVGEALRTLFSPATFAAIRRGAHRIGLLPQTTFLGFNVTALITDAVQTSLTNPDLFHNLLLEKAARRFVAASPPVRAVAYRYEGQPWEHALLNGIGADPVSIAFMHSPFGQNYLPMRFAPREIERNRRRTVLSARPLPQFVLTCGSGGADRVVRDGFGREQVAVCGPQRHSALLSYLGTKPRRGEIRRSLGFGDAQFVIFVAIAIVPQETQALFDSLVKALSSMGDYVLVVKTHPNRPEGDEALRRVLAALGPHRARVLSAKVSMYEAISSADVMVCLGSTVAFEAMALDVMPIVFEPPLFFAATSLAEYRDTLYVVRNTPQLYAALREVRDGSGESLTKREQWPEVLRTVMGDFDTSLSRQLDEAIAVISPQTGRSFEVPGS